MRVLIFEGIATSGKSTVIEGLLRRSLAGKVAVYSEQDTHVPIMQERSGLHLDFFNGLLDKALANGSDLVAFDRLYMTQAYRAHVGMANYEPIERRLQAVGAQTILLEVDESAIEARLEAAMKHRDPAWAEYVRGKAETVGAVAEQYAAQQRAVHEFAQKSLLPSQTFNTTRHEYPRIVDALTTI